MTKPVILNTDYAVTKTPEGWNIYGYIHSEDIPLGCVKDKFSGSVTLNTDAAMILLDTICSELGGCDVLKDAYADINNATARAEAAEFAAARWQEIAAGLAEALRDASRQLDNGLGRKLSSGGAPGHIDYISKLAAAEWCRRLAKETRAALAAYDAAANGRPADGKATDAEYLRNMLSRALQYIGHKQNCAIVTVDSSGITSLPKFILGNCTCGLEALLLDLPNDAAAAERGEGGE